MFSWKKRIKLDIKLEVPNWEYCNCINPSNPGVATTDACRFLMKIKTGNSKAATVATICLLHDQMLTTEFEMVRKCDACWRCLRCGSFTTKDPFFISAAK